MRAKEDLIQSLIDDGYLKNPRIIDAFRAIDRADFVRPERLDEAYGNYPLPIGEGQTISQPLTVAFMLELLDPQPGEKILDIGAGSGWTTALLAYLVSQGENPRQTQNPKSKTQNGRVLGIERVGELCGFGQKNLAKYFDESRAKIICGDGTLGYAEEAPYDKILAGAAASREIPQAWRDQLKIGGRIVAPVEGSIWLFTKKPASAQSHGKTQWEEKEFPGFSFVPLVRDKEPKTKDESKNPAGSLSTKANGKPRTKLTTTALVFSLLILGLLSNEIYRPHAAFSNSKSIEIPQGFGSRKIAELLKKEGVIRSKSAFIIYVTLKNKASQLKPGNYVFSRAAIPKIVGDLVRGGTNERMIIIPEGWSVKDIATYLEREGIVSSEDFLAVAEHQELNNFKFLEAIPAKATLEGFLFPDTYRIFKDAKPEDIAIKMLENFDRKVTPELRQEINRQGKTLFKIITMASLIEKEVRKDEDRVLVSGILWKRLKIGMALQVDATITYLTDKKDTKVSREETKIDSPYNTYKYPGLPAGPIANPGLSAIRAAIYPKDSPYLYYLSAPDGRTIFSRTLEEHNAAKAKYLAR